MSKHTKEPWEFDGSGGRWSLLQGDHEADIGELGSAYSAANARRIVACVNACAGLSTEALESGALADLVKAVGCQEPDRAESAHAALLEGR